MANPNQSKSIITELHRTLSGTPTRKIQVTRRLGSYVQSYLELDIDGMQDKTWDDYKITKRKR